MYVKGQKERHTRTYTDSRSALRVTKFRLHTVKVEEKQEETRPMSTVSTRAINISIFRFGVLVLPLTFLSTSMLVLRRVPPGTPTTTKK